MKSILYRLPLIFSLLLVCILPYQCQSQHPGTEKLVANEAFRKKINSYLNFSIPVMGVDELNKNKKDYVILDAREKEEFQVSHIPDAKYIGYSSLDKSALNLVSKDQKIVVYCSIGYRSEKVSEKLRIMGYKNVTNLYGSIFEWANEGLPLEDANGKPSKNLHAYNKSWSKWVDNKSIKKTW